MTHSQRLTIEDVSAAVRDGFGPDVLVSARRPGKIFQVDLPAFMADGDAVSAFIQPGSTRDLFRVTDLANTLMRLTYEQDLTPEMELELEELADRNGFSVREGEVFVETTRRELSAALMGMVQIQACAEAIIRPRTAAAPRAEDFRRLVIEALRAEFRDLVRERVARDKDSEEFAIDAVVDLPRPIAVAAVPNDLEAERAIANKLQWGPEQTRFKWLAVPRDLEKLQRKTKGRLISAYFIAGPEFEPAAVPGRVKELAA